MGGWLKKEWWVRLMNRQYLEHDSTQGTAAAAAAGHRDSEMRSVCEGWLLTAAMTLGVLGALCS